MSQLQPFDLPATTHSYLARAAESLSEAVGEREVAMRYAGAHVSALRAAAALLAARARPEPSRRRPQRNAWVLLAEVAPELAEWARFFAAGADKRAAAEAGSARAVTAREADDLIRDADRFLGVIEQTLGLQPHVGVGAQQLDLGVASYSTAVCVAPSTVPATNVSARTPAAAVTWHRQAG